jgi:hypothetical protein
MLTTAPLSSRHLSLTEESTMIARTLLLFVALALFTLSSEVCLLRNERNGVKTEPTTVEKVSMIDGTDHGSVLAFFFLLRSSYLAHD